MINCSVWWIPCIYWKGENCVTDEMGYLQFDVKPNFEPSWGMYSLLKNVAVVKCFKSLLFQYYFSSLLHSLPFSIPSFLSSNPSFPYSNPCKSHSPIWSKGCTTSDAKLSPLYNDNPSCENWCRIALTVLTKVTTPLAELTINYIKVSSINFYYLITI